MTKEVKIIHTGDLHLGMTFKSLGDKSKLHRRDCQDVFSSIIDLCIKEKADALLIAGDLFDEPNPSKPIVSFVIDEFKELKEKSEEHELAYTFLEKAETEVQQKFTPSIEKNSKPILEKVTNKKYSELKINEEDLSITVKAPEIKEFVPVDILSQGAKDQIYFTIRTTMTDLLSGNINIPLIFDDPFHNFDDVRLKKTISTMKELAKNKQIILISHKPYQKEFKNFAENVIEVT